jgi:hypothetical protein
MESVMEKILEPQVKNRIIVLLPESLAGNLPLAYKINGMAAHNRRDVLFLTLLEEKEQKLSVTRLMATMKAATAGDQINVAYRLVYQNDWLTVLKDTWRPGDLVVCQQEQSVKAGFLRTVPMKEYLQDKLEMPSRTLSGFYHPWNTQAKQWLLGLAFWIGCLVILAGFTLLEIQIDHVMQGLARTALLLTTVAFEVGMLSVWNRLPRV